MTENKSYNLDYTFDLAIKKLLKKPHNQVCEATGANYDVENKLYTMPYLNTLVSISELGTIDTADKKLTLQEQILIVHYLLSGGSLKQIDKQNLISFKELPGGEIYIRPFTNRAIKPFLKIFSNQPQKMDLIAEIWGGNVESFGDKSFSLSVFPYVKIYYVLWLGDEEFPANATVLFSNNIKDYLTTEDVAVLASQLVYQMLDLLS